MKTTPTNSNPVTRAASPFPSHTMDHRTPPMLNLTPGPHYYWNDPSTAQERHQDAQAFTRPAKVLFMAFLLFHAALCAAAYFLHHYHP